MVGIARNIELVRERISSAAERSGRKAEDVTLVAVTKTRTAKEIAAAISAGIGHVGENRVQETKDKRTQIKLAAQWHLIGHLQSNKVRNAVELYDVIQTVDSFRLVSALHQRALQANRIIDVMVQVNSSGSPKQNGVSLKEVLPLAENVADMSNLRFVGLMTIAELTENQVRLRTCFRDVRRMFDKLTAVSNGGNPSILSMGMSGDFEIAIEEGANMVRVGTAIFGHRPVI